MDEQKLSETGSAPRKEIPWRLFGFILAALLVVLFVLRNRDRVTIDFLFFDANTRQWVSLVIAVALGVISDRLFIGIRRRRHKND